MAVTTGYNVTTKLLTGGTCSCSSGVLTITGGTCTNLPYMDTYTYDSSLEEIDTTGFGDTLRHNVDGFPDYTVSISGGLDLTNAIQQSLANSATCGTARKPRVFKIADGGKNLMVRGRLNAQSQGSSVGGKSTFSIGLHLTHLPTWS